MKPKHPRVRSAHAGDAAIAPRRPSRPTSSLARHHSSPAPPPTFLFAGGGSGGHLYPGIAVAEELASRDPRCRILFVGSERGIERAILAGTDWRHFPLPIAPPGAMRASPLRASLGLAASLSRSLRLIEEVRPAAVIGLGGFASLPVALAARCRRVRTVLLEQNLVPGRATSLLSRTAELVCVSFEETSSRLPRCARWVATGNPVRTAVLTKRATPAGDTLLVLGGSQGAVGLNSMTIAAVVRLQSELRGWKIVHQTGRRDVDRVRAAYDAAGVNAEVAEFFDDLPARYASAALVVSRAGATTLAELACVGVPAVLVPYPGAVRDHQSRNADSFAAAGGAAVVPEGPDGEARLAQALAPFVSSPERRAFAGQAIHRLGRPDATSAVADLLLPRLSLRAAA